MTVKDRKKHEEKKLEGNVYTVDRKKEELR